MDRKTTAVRLKGPLFMPLAPLSEQLVQSRYGFREVAAGLAATFVLAGLGLLFIPWQQSVRATGRVVAYAPVERQQIIEAPIEGRVVRIAVREGSRVQAGEPVVELADNDPDLLRRLREERDAVKARLFAAEARSAAIGERLRALSSSRGSAVSAATARAAMAADRLRAASQALSAAEATKKTAQLNLERQRALLGHGLASKRNLELAELEALRASTESERAAAALSAAQGDKSAFRAERRRVSTDGDALLDDARASRAAAEVEVANARAELTRLEVRLARQNSQTVTAPRAGTILRLLAVQGGEMVKAGDPLLVFVPDTADRAVELWLDGNDVPLVAEGRKVRLQLEGWPAVQFVGWPSVAVGTFPGVVALVDAADNGKGRFRVLVVPEPGATPHWPSERYLRQGVRANGWVLLDRVRLGYELWRQWNGFPPTVAPTGDEESKDAKAKTKEGR